MASERQIEANRRNAAGPHNMSEEGKESLRTNAIRHGLAAKRHIVLTGEDKSFYDELLNALLDHHAPADPQEEMLVHQIAEHHWRLLRARSMETASFEANLDDYATKYGQNIAELDAINYAGVLTMGLSKLATANGQIQRYETTAERSYYRAIRELAKIQKARKQDEAKQIRSVPQNHESERSEPTEPVVTPEPIPVIRSVPKFRKNYTAREMEEAHARMSD